MISFLETLFQIHIYLFGISFEDKCNFDAVNRDDKEASNGKSQDHPNASVTPLTGDIVIGGRRERVGGWDRNLLELLAPTVTTCITGQQDLFLLTTLSSTSCQMKLLLLTSTSELKRPEMFRN